MMFFFAAAIAANTFLGTFGGTYACTQNATAKEKPVTSQWSIKAEPGSPWSVVHWKFEHEAGTAYVGFLKPLSVWMYNDFHSDGTFASSTSSGPANGGVWTWTATITTQQRVLHGAIQWKRDGDTIRQTYGRVVGQSFSESGYAICKPVR